MRKNSNCNIMRRRYLSLAIFTLLTFTLTSFWSCENSSDAVTYEITATPADNTDAAPAERPEKGVEARQSSRLTVDDSRNGSGSAPYQLGQKHARELSQVATDTSRLNDCLLDINARITNIRNRIGAEAEQDYIRGLSDALRRDNPSLAATLF